ncbi:MAG: RtcB family protein, partial [Candidatus Methanomethylophilaceae archaeon]|nr:RtcB family protein [Candidatus Methanomethylophilaceae archaeon]
AGCTIGTTMTLKDRVTPNLVGVDIGCGMIVAELGRVSVDPFLLEEVIERDIPSGMSVRERGIPETDEAYALLDELRCPSGRRDYNALSAGTLGGGNHFIELDEDDGGNLYLVVHSGSRNLGKKVCEHYQRLAESERYRAGQGAVAELIARLKAEGRARDIQEELKRLPRLSGSRDPLAWLEGPSFADYIHDMGVCQRFASLNRRAIVRVITEGLGLEPASVWQTVHNYIDIGHMILRKGSISARRGERVIIPMNMRDGSLICTGKGNPDWNWSAPHGAGRLLSRSDASRQIALEDFRKDMEGVASWSVCTSTLDEAPGAYKPTQSIISQIGPTVTVDNIIRPVFNYKAH